MNRIAIASAIGGGVLGLTASVLAPVPAVAAANPVYTICNAAASAGANPINDMNRLERRDPSYPVIKIWEGECKNVTVTPTTRIWFINYNSWRVTSDLGAPANSSSYSACHTGASSPGGDRKYKGYPSNDCSAVPGA